MTLRILGGQYKGRLLKSPKETTTRPTQGILRQAVFNICQTEIEGATFLDLFAGSGAMGLEALSRGAKSSIFVEKDRYAANCIRENIHSLGMKAQTQVLNMDAAAALKKLADPFDIIYIDPPYDSCIKDLVETILFKNLLASLLFIEERQKNHILLSHPSLELYDTKRYGIALLSIFRKKSNS